MYKAYVYQTAFIRYFIIYIYINSKTLKAFSFKICGLTMIELLPNKPTSLNTINLF